MSVDFRNEIIFNCEYLLAYSIISQLWDEESLSCVGENMHNFTEIDSFDDCDDPIPSEPCEKNAKDENKLIFSGYYRFERKKNGRVVVIYCDEGGEGNYLAQQISEKFKIKIKMRLTIESNLFRTEWYDRGILKKVKLHQNDVQAWLFYDELMERDYHISKAEI